MNPQKDQDYLSAGISEEIITNITQIPFLKVIAYAAMLKYMGSDKDISDIGEELGISIY